MHESSEALGDKVKIGISHSFTALCSPKPTPMDPAIKKLTKQFAAFSLLIGSGMSGPKQAMATFPRSSDLVALTAATTSLSERFLRRIW